MNPDTQGRQSPLFKKKKNITHHQPLTVQILYRIKH